MEQYENADQLSVERIVPSRVDLTVPRAGRNEIEALLCVSPVELVPDEP